MGWEILQRDELLPAMKVYIVLFYEPTEVFGDKIAGVFLNKEQAYYQFGDSDEFYIEEHEAT
jgi:hypothetical protein